MPDAYAPDERGDVSPRRRRRTVAIAALLVLAVAAGAGVAVKGGLLSFSESCEDSAVRLTPAASPDIAPAIRSIAEQARDDEVRSDGHCLAVEVVARDSYKVAEALASGGEAPGFQVWLPDSDLWLDRAEGLVTGTPISPSDSVASSPVALAMVPSASQRLGWPEKTYSWAELVVVDASGSMSTPVPGRGQSRMDVTKESLIQALAQFTPDDEIGLWEFATTLDGAKDYRKVMETRRLGDPAPGGSTHRGRLAAAFAGLQPVPGGATGLYDTVPTSYEEARSTYVKGKFNALVILTDSSNQDDDGISRSALIAQLKKLPDLERPVPVIAIAVGPDADREEAAEIARVTGGDGYEVSDPAEIQAAILRAVMTAGQNGRAAQE